MNPQQTRFAHELHYGILSEKPFQNTYPYHIAIAPKEQLVEWEKAWEDQGRLLANGKISNWPQKMAQGMDMHYHEYQQKYSTQPAHCGNMAFKVVKKDGKTIAFAEVYYPNAYRERIHGKGNAKGSGIQAALLEIACLEHLRKAAGVTHMTTTDCLTPPESKKERKTSQDRRDQLEARGLHWNKIYPIDEWIAKLKSKPDYSRISAANRMLAKG